MSSIPPMRLWLLMSLPFVFACDLSPEKAKLDPTLKAKISDLEAKQAQNPKDLQIALDLAATYLEGGERFKSADAFLLARDIDPKAPQPRLGLSIVYDDLGYTARAYQELEMCVVGNPEHPECLYRLGNFLLLRDGSEPAFKRARDLFMKLLEVMPNHPKAPLLQDAIQGINDRVGPPTGPSSQPSSQPATGQPTTGQPTTGQPDQPASQPAAPSAAAPQTGPGAAIGAHAAAGGDEDVGELNPFGKAISEAMAAAQKQDVKTAEAAFRRALAISPDDPLALGGLAEALFQQKKIEEAQQTIEKAYAKDPQEPLVQWVFGLIMVKSGKDTQRGLAAWKRLQSENPGYAKQLGLERLISDVERFQK